MLDIPVHFKSEEEIENKIYNSELNYLRINILDWINRCLPGAIYMLGTEPNRIIEAFRMIICNAKIDKDLITWLNNNLDVLIKRQINLLLKNDPRKR